MRAVLYLHQCEPDHAQAALFSIPKVPVILCSNFFCLTDPSTVKVLVSSSLKWFSCSIELVTRCFRGKKSEQRSERDERGESSGGLRTRLWRNSCDIFLAFGC